MSKSIVFERDQIKKVEKNIIFDWKPIVLKILSIMLTIIVLAELLFYFIFLPIFSPISITIEGCEQHHLEQLYQTIGLTNDEPWTRFNASIISQKLSLIPAFESVVVEKRFPNQAVISIKQRKPVVVAFKTINGRTVPLEIDKSGVIFRIGNTKIDPNLPLLTGLNLENLSIGDRINSKLRSFFEDLLMIEKTNPELLASISEIKIEEKTYGGYDLVLYPMHTPIKVITDQALNQQGLQYMMLVLDVVEDLGLNIDEIDIRSGVVAYKYKGEQA